MKIICIGRNYVDHAKELNNAVPTEPVVFIKPDSAILQTNKPFFIPSFSNDVHHELEIVVKINKVGKHIQPQFAPKYYSHITVGIDFTARDLQTQLKQKGLPWEKAKAFDGSAPVGKFIPIDNLGDIQNIDFSLYKNDILVQEGNTQDMLFKVNEIIAYVSKFFTLKIGDLIFTGTPAGVGKVAINDRLSAYIGDQKLLEIPVK